MRICSLPEGPLLQELGGAPNRRALVLLGGDVLVSAGDGNTYSLFPDAKIGVLGVNGAGKSTLFRIMAGVDRDFGRRGLPRRGPLHRPPPSLRSKTATASGSASWS